MECPRCETDVDGTVSYCPECGLNFDEIRQELGLTDDAPSASGGDGKASAGSEPGNQDELASHSKHASSSDASGGRGNAAGGAAAGDATGSAAPQAGGARGQQPPQESDGLLTRRRLLVGGVGVAGIGLWQTGNLEWLLGGSGDWPVPDGVERVSVESEQKERIRGLVGSQDAQIRVYSTTEGNPASYYQTDSVDGWERQAGTPNGGTYRKDDQGLIVVVQERGQILDLGLPATTPTPIDVVLIKADWQTINN